MNKTKKESPLKENKDSRKKFLKLEPQKVRQSIKHIKTCLKQ